MSHQQLYLVEDGFLYYGIVKERDYHQHYALQLSIGIEEPVVVKSPDKFIKADGICTPSRMAHKLSTTAAPALVLFVLPTSLLANYCQQHFSTESIQELPVKMTKELVTIGKHIHKQNRTTKEILKAYSQWRKKYLLAHAEVTKRDADINYLLDWTYAIAKQPVPLQEAADRIHMPVTHFSNVFRKEVGMPYKKVMQMSNVIEAYHELGKIKDLKAWVKAAGLQEPRQLRLSLRELFGWPLEQLLEESYWSYQRR